MTTEAALLLTVSYLLPVGFFVLGWSGIEPQRSRQAAVYGLLALALAALGYFAVGFAFHLGGAAVVSDQPGLGDLDRLLGYRVERGMYWGVIGLDGFFLLGAADTPEALTLFATYLTVVVTAVLLPMLSLSGRARGWQTASLGLLTATVVFPLAACWTWGGGWLAALGLTVERGHGLVDYAGSGVVYLLAGMVALGGLAALGRVSAAEKPAEMPPTVSPLRATVGALLVAVGWLGWSLATPFHSARAQIDPGRVAVNGLLATAAATLACLAYCWLTLRRGDPLMLGRGAVAGLVAISAGAPFVPPWAAAVIGGVAGLLLPLGVYLTERVLRLADGAATVAMGALGGLWGLLAVGLFADGRWGQGWNGVPDTYRHVPGQGVTGFLASPGFLDDGRGQSIAQLAGLACIALLGFLGGWLLIKLLSPRTRSRETQA